MKEEKKEPDDYINKGWLVSSCVINFLRLKAFPQTIASIWSGKSDIDEESFKANPRPFLEKKVQQQFNTTNILPLPPMFIDQNHHFDIRYRQTGLHFPWPPRPVNMLEVYEMYVTRKVFPHPISIPYPEQVDQTALKAILNKKRKPQEWELKGDKLQSLVEAWPRIIAKVWSNDELHDELFNNPEALKTFALKQEELEFSHNMEIHFIHNLIDPVIFERGLILPFPARPSLERLYDSWSNGQAQIPTFTPCDCYIGGDGSVPCCFPLS